MVYDGFSDGGVSGGCSLLMSVELVSVMVAGMISVAGVAVVMIVVIVVVAIVEEEMWERM